MKSSPVAPTSLAVSTTDVSTEGYESARKLYAAPVFKYVRPGAEIDVCFRFLVNTGEGQSFWLAAMSSWSQ